MRTRRLTRRVFTRRPRGRMRVSAACRLFSTLSQLGQQRERQVGNANPRVELVLATSGFAESVSEVLA